MQAMTFTIIPFCSLPLTQSPIPRLFIASFLMTIKLIRKLSSMVVVVSTAHFFWQIACSQPCFAHSTPWAMQLNANCRFCYATAAKVGSKCTLIKESSSMINFSFPPTKDKGWFANYHRSWFTSFTLTFVAIWCEGTFFALEPPR